VIYLLLIIHLIHLSKKKSRIELSDTPPNEVFLMTMLFQFFCITFSQHHHFLIKLQSITLKTTIL